MLVCYVNDDLRGPTDRVVTEVRRRTGPAVLVVLASLLPVAAVVVENVADAVAAAVVGRVAERGGVVGELGRGEVGLVQAPAGTAQRPPGQHAVAVTVAVALGTTI